MTTELNIGKHIIGPDHPTYFIADIAANHDGDLKRAKDLIYLCAEAGANAAKFQNFSASTIVSDYGFREFGEQISHQAKWSKSVFDAYQDVALPLQWTKVLKQTCDDAGIDYFTAPYDLSLIPKLSDYVCAWKLGSGDITWYQNIETMAKDGKPLLIATGASTLNEVHRAMDVATNHTDKIVLMQCNTNYTASIDNFRFVELNVLNTYKQEFPGIILGLSDHTPGHTTVLGAVTLGARAIEKHFTDHCNREGPDHQFSMDPVSWKSMVDSVRELELALGSGDKRVMENEFETVIIQRRGLRANRDLGVGETICEEDLIPLRPCTEDCLPPYRAGELIGRTLIRQVLKGDCVKLIDLQ